MFDNGIEIEIEYNEEQPKINKTTSNFPTKKLGNEKLQPNDKQNISSKSLNFNHNIRKCFAPKWKTKIPSENPRPMIYVNHKDNNNPIAYKQTNDDDIFSEKECNSLEHNSSLSSADNEIKDNVNIISESNSENKSEKNGGGVEKSDEKNKQEEKKFENFKSFGHKTITVFPVKNKIMDNKINIKSYRNSLLKIKKNIFKAMNKETEFTMKDKMKIKFNFEIKNNNVHYNDDYSIVIPINDRVEEVNKKESNKLRKTTGLFHPYKDFKLSKSTKGLTIFDVISTKQYI